MSDRTSLPTARIALVAGGLALVMVVALAQALGSNLFAQGGLVMDLAWGRTLLVDIYVGLLLFSLWIGWREPARGTAAAWILALLLLGNIVACVYVLAALRAAGGQPERFWNGPA